MICIFVLIEGFAHKYFFKITLFHTSDKQLPLDMSETIIHYSNKIQFFAYTSVVIIIEFG